jgi:hypothetical protein
VPRNNKLALQPDAHRRRASALYGLIIAGAVLATVGIEDRLLVIAGSLLATLVVYWLAETYVHLMSERAVERHVLDRQSATVIARDGLPLISVSFVPLAVLLLAALIGLPPAGAAEWALYVNTAVLLLEGYRISRDAGVVGFRLLVAVTFTGLLGLALVGLKAAISH